jgi:hypothetical protein
MFIVAHRLSRGLSFTSTVSILLDSTLLALSYQTPPKRKSPARESGAKQLTTSNRFSTTVEETRMKRNSFWRDTF